MKSSGKSLSLLFTGLAIAIGVLALIATGDEEASSGKLCSTYNAGPTGVKALYVMLRESGLDVVRWRREATRIPAHERVLFVSVAPVETYSSADIAYLNTLVRRGSTCVLFYSPALEGLLSSFGLEAEATDPPPALYLQSAAGHAVFSDQMNPPPDRDSADRPSGGYYALHAGSSRPLYGFDTDHYILESLLDSGAVLVFGTPLFVVNAGVGDSTNITTLMRLLLYDTQGRHRIFDRIVFDEYHQGFKEYQSIISILDDPAVKTGLVMGLVALMLLVYSRAKRIGRAVPIQTRSARSSMDYVESVTNAFERARANAWVLKTWYDWVRHRYALKFHTNLNERLADQLSKRYGFTKEHILRLMETVEKKLADADIEPEEKPIRKRPVAISDEEVVALVKRLDELYAAHHQRNAPKRK